MNATAGAFSSFALKLNREDGDQYLGQLNFTMPPGLTANLHGVTYCPKPTSSRRPRPSVKSSERTELSGVERNRNCNVAAGPGTTSLPRDRKGVYGWAFEVRPAHWQRHPAIAGPYDYGTVVVRVAVHVDPTDAHVIADSETIPEIIGGIPLRMREIRVNIESRTS